MPLRYAYEGMVGAQATCNPFEVERISLQRKIDAIRDRHEDLSAAQAERFELLKEGLRRLLAAGATTPDEAKALVSRIARIARSGNKLEVETMKVWPDNATAVVPASEFFVNERIDLLVREAETFRNDYRKKERRIVFNALTQPLPWAKVVTSSDARFTEPTDEIDTRKYCAAVLCSIVLGCGAVSTMILSRQNRRTRSGSPPGENTCFFSSGHHSILPDFPPP